MELMGSGRAGLIEILSVKSPQFWIFTNMSSPKVQGFNYDGYEEVAEKYGISAAVSVQLSGTQLITTSGHVGMDENGQIAQSLRAQMALAFKVG
jgi:hypothetical protein